MSVITRLSLEQPCSVKLLGYEKSWRENKHIRASTQNLEFVADLLYQSDRKVMLLVCTWYGWYNTNISKLPGCQKKDVLIANMQSSGIAIADNSKMAIFNGMIVLNLGIS